MWLCPMCALLNLLHTLLQSFCNTVLWLDFPDVFTRPPVCVADVNMVGTAVGYTVTAGISATYVPDAINCLCNS